MIDRRRRAVWLLAAGLLVLALPAFVPPASGAGTPYPPLTGSWTGPTLVGESSTDHYHFSGSGGPAEAANGSTVGTYSYNASTFGTNTSNVVLSPANGVLVNGTINLTLVTTNLSQTLTLTVDLTSSFGSHKVSTNVTYSVNVVVPYRISAVLFAPAHVSVAPFNLTVTLDGTPVGQVAVPTMTPGTTTPVTFSYVTTGLAPGYHTFAISLAQEHGLVTFAGGSETFTDTVYVPGPPTDWSLWIGVAIAALAGAIVIWLARVGARRRGRSRK